MTPYIIVGGVLVFLGVLQMLRPKDTQAAPKVSADFKSPVVFGPELPLLDALYARHGKEKGVDPTLLKALAITESSEDPRAVNPADPSVGLMQILCVPNGAGG